MKTLALFGLATSRFAMPANGQQLAIPDARLRLPCADQPYRLFVPANYDSTRAYPLVLFLHDGAGCGSSDLAQPSFSRRKPPRNTKLVATSPSIVLSNKRTRSIQSAFT